MLRVKPIAYQKNVDTTFGRFARNVYSQGGEDGIVQAIFDCIGDGRKWCVEFGAWDGVYLSNTCRLIREHDWSAVLIEGNSERCADIRKNHPDATKVYAAEKMIGFTAGADTIDDALAETPIPKDFDFISIDVDGIDWHIWDSIKVHRPRLVCIEFNPVIPNEVVFVQDRDFGVNEGCSIAALIELGKTKGYELCCVSNGNAFFIVAEEYSKLGIPDNSLEMMRQDRRFYLFNGYNGKIYNTLTRFNWFGRAVQIAPTSLQMLSEFSYHGVAQGRARDIIQQLKENPHGIPLNTADDILQEIFFLRGNRKSLADEEFTSRNVAAWAAAKQYCMRNREHLDGDVSDAVQGQTTRGIGHRQGAPVG